MNSSWLESTVDLWREDLQELAEEGLKQQLEEFVMSVHARQLNAQPSRLQHLIQPVQA